MILHLEPNIDQQQLKQVLSTLQEHKLQTHEVKTGEGHYLVAASKNYPDIRYLGALPGIRDIHRVSDQYKLVSAKWKLNATTIDLGDEIKIGPGEFQLMSGPCSIESEEQIAESIEHLKANNIKIMRGGVYKPRSSPYSFRGLGIDGLKIWYKACREAGLKIITEVMQVSQIEAMHDYIDIFQVGARNSQNFNLLDALGEVQKPVLLKRGISGTVDELLQAGEYIFSGGNEHVIFCERGIRTYETAYRNTLDLNAVALLKEKSHLPVVVDPSHGIGVRKFVEPVALAGIMAGADGLIVETHSTPERAFSDGQQTLNFKEAKELYSKARATFDFRESIV